MSLKDPSDPDSVINLKNFGERSSRYLHGIGITTISQLRRIGSAEAYMRMRHAGMSVSLVVLWALEMGLHDRPYTAITAAEKKSLLDAVREIDPTFRRR